MGLTSIFSGNYIEKPLKRIARCDRFVVLLMKPYPSVAEFLSVWGSKRFICNRFWSARPLVGHAPC